MSDEKMMTIDMACHCGATLRIEWPISSNYLGDVVRLANTWVATHAHKPNAVKLEGS